ncbi:COX15/CtaA family protein [Pseudoroseomonas globiformis]|uniref:Heme A synthase n=1 Tax=Teichococcus globiformis TaxID=2307229 RepID=A0ABV7FT61_9PROT
MPFDPHPTPRNRDLADRQAIGWWLLGIAFMIWVMVALGGATRLTGSGLSIMEWAPISGMLPPLSQTEWERLYELYRTIPQYQIVNQGFGLEGFKQIFWLEWLHRLWGRLIGLAFALPLAWFWLRGRIPSGLKPRLLLLFLLGGAQGAVGWFMVASGFEADRTAVSPYRLVVHLGLALLLYGVVLWTAMGLFRPGRDAPPHPSGLRRLAHGTAGLVVLAMLAGGFTAGIHAGFAYNTFPLMEGRLIPDGYAQLSPFIHNFTANIAAVQFNHRFLATLAACGAVGAAFWGAAALPASFARTSLLALGWVVALQYALGVATLLLVVPAWLGTLHQTVAVAVLTATLAALHGLRRPRQT